MSRPCFLADQDFNEHIVRGVRRREPTIRFVKLREVGMERRPDSDVLAYAASHQLIVISHDVNTMAAAAHARTVAGQPMNGLFLVHQTDPYGPTIEDLVLIATASEAEEWINQVRFLPL